MGQLIKPKVRPVFDIMVFPYKDRIVGHVTCNRCGEKFSLTLRASPEAIKQLVNTDEGEKYIRLRLFQVANAVITVMKILCLRTQLKRIGL